MKENFYKKQLRVPGKIKRGEEHAVNFGLIPSFFLLLLAIALLISPAFWIKGIADNFGKTARRTSAEAYTLFKFFLFSIILYCGVEKDSAWFWISLILLIDLHIYLFGLIFLRKFWGGISSIERSLFLMLFNLGEIILAFSIIHLATGGIGNIVDGVEIPINSSLNAIYFSIVTITTLGYGDYAPISCEGKVTVIFQVISAVIFFIIFLGAFIGKYAAFIKEQNENET